MPSYPVLFVSTVPLSVCRPLCGSSVEHVGGPVGSSAGVSPPSPSPGARIDLNTHGHTMIIHFLIYNLSTTNNFEGKQVIVGNL